MLSISEEILQKGVAHRWRIESMLITPGKPMHELYLKHCIEKCAPLYSCNRPPGAAGAIIVSSEKVIYGWVAPTLGAPSCKEVGCEMEDGHCIRNVHAEVQAIIRAARHGISTSGATIYSLLKPCYNCTKAIIHAGITKIVYAGAAYDEERTRNILSLANVECEYVDINLEYGIMK